MVIILTNNSYIGSLVSPYSTVSQVIKKQKARVISTPAAEGTLYTDATCALQVRSIDVNQNCYVENDYDKNYVHTFLVEDLTDTTIIKTFDMTFEGMEQKGHKPCLNITNIQAVAPLKQYLAQKNCRWQFFEPSNHQVNATERAIQTWKNHIISGMCSADKEWPLQLWDQLTEQVIITLNLCRTSRKDQALSAYHSFHGNI